MKNNYLTILSGNPRGGERTWHSLYENVLNPLSSDLAICTGDKWLKNQSFLQVSNYQWIIDEPDDWENYYKEHFDGTWKEYFLKGENTGLYSSGLIHFALKDIILKNHINEILKYDYIIFTRFDQFYINQQNYADTLDIWIPEGEDYFGLCDRHAVVPNKYIRNYLNICEYVNSENALKTNDSHLNCEVSYLNYLKNIDVFKFVKRYKRTQFTASLKDDFTNWRVPKYKIHFYNNLWIKYPDEYISSFESLSSRLSVIFSKNLFLYLNYLYLKLRRLAGKLKSKGT
tara:strand:+ start:974 stop:1831 length:858 start_codon:yes stop_codon:yes gene_type:complete